MAEFSESLTIRILADSSQFRQELGQTLGLLEELAAAGQPLNQLAQSLASLSRPLAGLSRQLGGITQQLRQLSQVPVTLNIAPALQSLNLLRAQINAVGNQWQGLGAAPAPVRAFAPFARFAAGGLVSGPAGVDRVPALLSAGEFVLQSSAVRQLGVGLLQSLNQARAPLVPSPAPSMPQTVNHFGGISVNVSQPLDASRLVRELNQAVLRQRNRQG